MTVPDADDTTYCYRHPGEATGLQCIECDRPICPDCAVQAPVGFKCPDCGRISRRAAGRAPAASLVRATAAGVGVVAIGGVLALGANVYLFGGFFGLIIAALIGTGAGELVRRASGGYRDPAIASIAAVSVAVAIAAPLVRALILSGFGYLQAAPISVAFDVLAIIIGAVAASRRARWR